MDFNRIKYRYTLFSGTMVLIGVSIIIFALAYFNRGHPPASGIYALAVIFFTTPLSIISLIISFIGSTDYSAYKQKLFYIFLGINIFWVFFIAQAWFYKAILGKAL